MGMGAPLAAAGDPAAAVAAAVADRVSAAATGARKGAAATCGGGGGGGGGSAGSGSAHGIGARLATGIAFDGIQATTGTKIWGGGYEGGVGAPSAAAPSQDELDPPAATKLDPPAATKLDPQPPLAGLPAATELDPQPPRAGLPAAAELDPQPPRAGLLAATERFCACCLKRAFSLLCAKLLTCQAKRRFSREPNTSPCPPRLPRGRRSTFATLPLRLWRDSRLPLGPSSSPSRRPNAAPGVPNSPKPTLPPPDGTSSPSEK